MRTSVHRFLSVFLSLCSLREPKKKIKIKQVTLRPCAISFKLRFPSLEWQCTITPQIATRGYSKTCLEDYLSRLWLWNGRSSIPCLSERRLCLCNKTFEKAREPSSRLFSNSPRLRRHAVHEHNLRPCHHISPPKSRIVFLPSQLQMNCFDRNIIFICMCTDIQ